MSQLKLITESEWTPTELLMTLHAKVDRIQQTQEHMSRMLATVLAAVQDDPQTLHKLVRGLSVVPFEDESLPALATCPQCEAKAETEEQVEERFGYRTMEDGKVRVQSWCRSCRSQGEKSEEKPPRRRAKATHWSKMDALACAFAKAFTQARNEMRYYQAKAADDKHAPSVRVQYQTKADTKRKEAAKHKSEYNKRVAVLAAGLTK